MTDICLQDLYSPRGGCFGCGPANPSGLRLQSFIQGAEVVAQWQPGDEYQAFPGMLNGGIIGTLLDCHSNWAAAWHLMKLAGLDQPLCTVTADYAIKLLRPTPLASPVELVARVVESAANRATIEAVLTSDNKPRATCRGTFVIVSPGHPAYHQW
jgi:acyl-coenzyme A thioesterase PaaI-like protein